MSSITISKLGRYEILEEVGRGSMGNVYRARDPKIGRLVAIKTIRAFGARPGEDEEYRKRFFREAQAAGRLSHPGIVTIYDVGEEEVTESPYIVMEYIEGRTLESLLTDDHVQWPSLNESLDLVQQLAEALDYAHAQHIVHRDIKPANIIVTPEGRAKITDFGVARLAHAELTEPGQLLGTPAYMPPEQLNGDPVDGRSDLFSLGAILYWLLTGEKAFTGDPRSVITKILYGEPTPVTQLNPSLGPEFDRIMKRALAKDPAARFQRGKEFAEELVALREEQEERLKQGPLAYAPSPNVPAQASAGSAVVEKTVPLDAMGGSATPLPHEELQRINRVARKSFLKAALAVIAIGALSLLPVLLLRTMHKSAPDTSQSIASTAPTDNAASSTGVPPESDAAPSPPVLPEPKAAITPNASDTASAPKASGTATLQILCWHDADSSDLSVWVGDDLVYERELKVLGKRTRGYFSAFLSVPSGKRTVRVRVKSRLSKYDRTRTIRGRLATNQERTLEITSTELDNDLHLAWQN